MKGLRFLSLCFLGSISLEAEPERFEGQLSVVRRAEEMIAEFEQGVLRPGYTVRGVRADEDTAGAGPIIVNGPRILIEPLARNAENDRDSKLHFGVVILNGKDLAELGADVFPLAFAMLNHRFGYMRAIGASALTNLSGTRDRWYYWQSPWDGEGNQEDWAMNAKAYWLKWYLEEVQQDSERFNVDKADVDGAVD